MPYEAAYSYATSTWATLCGAGATGCYVVYRTHSKAGKRLASPVLAVKTPFATIDEASNWITALEDQG